VLLPNRADLPTDFGRYELSSILGEGGMARVYLAHRSGPMGFMTDMALKIVKRKAGKRSEFVHLLTREAVIGGFLRHPNIVATVDFDQVEGHYFIGMEYVEGHTLEQLMKIAKRERSHFPSLLALDIVQQVCRGLSYAHGLKDRQGRDLNIIHRDIKPGNIMVSKHGVAKITDFGIAKASVETGVVTATNVVRGTPLYMSPEQATGRKLDFRSDLFSVGLILYELLTGKRLFEMRDIVSTMENIARAEIGGAPEEVDAVVPGVGRLLRRLLQLHPKARFDDAEDVEYAIAELANALANDAEDETDSSIREVLKELTVSSSTTPVEDRPLRTPTLADSQFRADLDLDTLDNLDGSKIRSMTSLENVASSKQAVDQKAETVPFIDPVIRRTSALLKAVLTENE
jgi:serine/threonine protein kinase